MNISEQTVLVTGANRGLGRAIAEELVARGATVYAAARDTADLALAGVTPIQLDITDSASVSRAADVATDVTVLINNAGTSTGADVLDGDIDAIRLEMETHYFGTLAMTRAFAPVIVGHGGGAILNVLSVLSWFTAPGVEAYSAGKSAEWALTNAVRLELADKNVRVSGFHVGYMDTDMAAAVDGPKLDPKIAAKRAVDGIEAGQYEILADELSRTVQENLSGGVHALYPHLA
ncbi:NAD(P)-dependent dehydrogenase (short-subunit alcohol dehydrogenase family) [Rhodococcus sp. 27YEA15]|uniref:SDR family oxidoreductase n=1 Tax=Rhodococcus sp. 27YEA15 TaxID=3156259 RepID=UPI003C7C20C0